MILGISFGYHDSAAALIDNSTILFAAHEERYTRKKFDPSFPFNVISQISKKYDLRRLEAVVIHEKPLLKLDRQIIQVLAGNSRDSFAFKDHVASLRKIFTFNPKKIRSFIQQATNLEISPNLKIVYSSHHLSHAAASFFTSNFSNSLVIVLDAVGEWESQSIWFGRDNELSQLWGQHFPHSIGLFYSAFTSYLGFKVNSGEYKMMGLAPYGKSIYRKELMEIINFDAEGILKLDLEKFDFVSGRKMWNSSLKKVLTVKPRKIDEPLNQSHADLAASVQSILEEYVFKLIAKSKLEFGNFSNICLGGGVALNCVLNAKIADTFGRNNVHIFPSAGDSGSSVGGALAYSISANNLEKNTPKRWNIEQSLLGQNSWDMDVENILSKYKLEFERLPLTSLAEKVAKELNSGKIVGIFEGRAEFGPRALGSRSIIADPRIFNGQILINEKIKFRESFRPFAPIVLREHASEWFYPDSDEMYMLRTSFVLNSEYDYVNPDSNQPEYLAPISILERLQSLRSPIPSVTHLDLSARVQTLGKKDPRFLRNILEKFYELTSCPVLVNTSFNVRGEPIVNTLEDALRCFFTTEIDFLLINDVILSKAGINKYAVKYFNSAVQED